MENTEENAPSTAPKKPVDVVVTSEPKDTPAEPTSGTPEPAAGSDAQTPKDDTVKDEIATEPGVVAPPEPVTEPTDSKPQEEVKADEAPAPTNPEPAPVEQNTETSQAEPVSVNVSSSESGNSEIKQPPAEETDSGEESVVPPVDDAPKEALAPTKQPPVDDAHPTVPTDPAGPDMSAPAAMGVAASQMGKPAHPHRNNKKLAVIVTVAVALLLSLIAVYVYLSTNSGTEGSNNNSSEQLSPLPDTEGVDEPVTPTDIDSTTTDIEQEVNGISDDSDLSQFDLSDTNLGL